MKTHAPMLLSLFAVATIATAKTDYALNGGQITFRVPDGWTAIMEKVEGNPQAIAFKVPDPSADGSEDSADVTVKTRQLRNPSDFAATVQEEFERSKAQGGYESDTGNTDTSVHQYSVLRGKTRYLVRDSFRLTGSIAIEVRCQRPLLSSTPTSWSSGFDAACGAVVASIAK